MTLILNTRNNAVNFSFIEKLRNWKLKFNISQSALNSLLSILKSINGLEHLPTDARSFMKTPRSVRYQNLIKKVDSGKFAIFGFAKGLSNSLSVYYDKPPTSIKVNLNIDGLPLAKSSDSQF